MLSTSAGGIVRMPLSGAQRCGNGKGRLGGARCGHLGAVRGFIPNQYFLISSM
jgi:hypothetical protein